MCVKGCEVSGRVKKETWQSEEVWKGRYVVLSEACCSKECGKFGKQDNAIVSSVVWQGMTGDGWVSGWVVVEMVGGKKVEQVPTDKYPQRSVNLPVQRRDYRHINYTDGRDH